MLEQAQAEPGTAPATLTAAGVLSSPAHDAAPWTRRLGSGKPAIGWRALTPGAVVRQTGPAGRGCGLVHAAASQAAILIVSCCAAAAAPAALVHTVTPRQGSIPDIITAYGTAIPALEGGNAISLQQSGTISAILVTPGDRVRTGNRLLVFDLDAASISVYRQAVAALGLAQTQRAHTAQLLAQRLATRDQLGQADKAVLDAGAALDALRRQGADRPRTEVNAPYDGVVDAIRVAQGDRVAAGTPLLTITRLDGEHGIDGLVVTVGIEPSLHERVRPGQMVSLRPVGGGGGVDGRALDSPASDNPGSGGSGFGGKVLRVDGLVNPRSRLVDVDIGVPPGRLLSGQAYAASITLGRLQGWIVPHEAVLNDESGDYLFQLRNGHATRVAVRDLGTLGDDDAVGGRLDPASPVVTAGATQLGEGDPVRTEQ